MHEALVRRALLHDFAAFGGIAARLLLEAQVLDHVLRRLRDDAPVIIEAFAPRAPADLLEIADAEDGGLLAVEFAQLREEHGTDRDVHADAERVRPADDLEMTLLREALDEPPVLRKQARVMQTD